MCCFVVTAYYNTQYFESPCVDWNQLRHRLDAVAYRPNELPASTQGLLSVIIASAARVTVHEGIIGPSPFKIRGALPLQEGVDVSVYGEKRDRMCVILAEEARKRMTQEDLLLTPCAESIAGLYLLYTLVNRRSRAAHSPPFDRSMLSISCCHTVGLDEKMSSGRLYSSMAVVHLRTLHEQQLKTPTHDLLFTDSVGYSKYLFCLPSLCAFG